MLKNCIFHERCSIAFGIVSDIECLHIVMFTFVYCLSIVVEKSYIFQKLWHYLKNRCLFTALQFSKRTKGLFKMNNNSI